MYQSNQPKITDKELTIAQAYQSASKTTRSLISTSQRLSKQKREIRAANAALKKLHKKLTDMSEKAMIESENSAYLIAKQYFTEEEHVLAFHLCKDLTDYLCDRSYALSSYGIKHPENKLFCNALDTVIMEIGYPAIDRIINTRPFDDEDIPKIARICIKAINCYLSDSAQNPAPAFSSNALKITPVCTSATDDHSQPLTQHQEKTSA